MLTLCDVDACDTVVLAVALTGSAEHFAELVVVQEGLVFRNAVFRRVVAFVDTLSEGAHKGI